MANDQQATEGVVEEGWRLKGETPDGRSVLLVVGRSELARAYPGLTAGRHPALSELPIDDPAVSRRHFRLSLGSEGLMLEDVNSLNGTWLGGQRLAPFAPVALHDGQVLRAGSVVLTVTALADGD